MIDLEAAAEALNSEPVVSPSPAEAIWQAGRRRRRRRIRRWRIGSGAVCISIAVAVALVLAANPTTESVVVEATQEPDPTRVAKETAERYADIYLDRLVLPDGAKPYLGAPPQYLLKAFATPGTPNLVDHHRFWRVPHNTGVTVKFLRSHPPAGMTGPEMSGIGSTGSQITVESLTYETTPAASSLLPTTIAELQVQVSVTADGTGSWVRADAQVLWRPERDPTTFLPDNIHAITISRKPNRQPDSNPGAGRVQITDMKAVTELVDAFNELTVAVPGEDHGCGMTPSYTLEFRSRASAAPELTATIYCRYVQVTINGHDAATLAKSAALSQPVAAIFGDQPPGTSQQTPSVSAADLRKFRDAAADAPYWYTVKWFPPSSVQQAVGNTSAVVVGTVRSARVDQPRADDLIPYEGAPTLYHLEVVVDIDVTRVVAGQVEGNVVQARIPVRSGPAEGLVAAGRAAADRIIAAAPENAVGVFLISRTSGTTKPVAFQSSTGQLVAFYRSMDEAVAPLDVEWLAGELAGELGGELAAGITTDPAEALRNPDAKSGVVDHAGTLRGYVVNRQLFCSYVVVDSERCRPANGVGWPVVSEAGDVAGFWLPGYGFIDPVTATDHDLVVRLLVGTTGGR